MRLLQYNTAGELSLTEDFPSNKVPEYAILSHTWGDQEGKAGYTKIRFCGDQATEDGLQFFWLQGAINSMFRWYRDAAKCYVYLSDAFRASRWFTRGWTLQELIAPASVDFFSREGHQIHSVTKIPLAALQGSPLSAFGVQERMAWIGERQTTHEEDRAYSLFGLFDVHMPLLYGEGETKAFRRLGEEIARGEGHIISRRDKENKILGRLNTSPYQDRKDVNPDRVPGTCEWFVSHPRFREWQGSQSSRILWVSADPGCGKSVLAKHLVDSVLPTTRSRLVCYFFFKDGFNDQINATSALCCILHQIFKQRRSLLSSTILDQLDAGGETITQSFSEIWKILIDVAKDECAGEIICLLDAVDECESEGRSQLARALCRLYGTTTNFNLKFLLTSRPYDEIRRSFQPLDAAELPMIRLSGESSAEISMISREISIFIKARAQDLATRLRLTDKEHSVLLGQLMRVPNQTYLWVHLTLDIIQKAVGVDRDKIVAITSQLPKTVNEAYDKILSKSGDPEMAIKILHIIVAAARPLTMVEMGVALALQRDHRSYDDLELKSEDRLRDDIRDVCGLFVTVIDSRIYLLHQTAREFLVYDKAGPLQGAQEDLRWKHVLQPQESHRILAEICVWHLLLAELETCPLDENGSLNQYARDHVFLDYSAKNWATHFRELPAGTQKVMTKQILEICDISSNRFRTWFRIYWTTTSTDCPEGFTPLMVASYFGLDTAAQFLRQEDGSDLDSRDATYQRSALSWAAKNGFDAVVKLLTEDTGSGLGRLKRRYKRGDRVNSVDKYGRTPLTYSVWSGNVATVKLLIKAGAKVAVRDEIGGTPLSYAICNGHEQMVEQLIGKGKQADSVGSIVRDLLRSAVKKGDEAVVELLVETRGVDINAEGGDGRTLLSHASEHGHTIIMKTLLRKADINAQGRDGATALHWATMGRDKAPISLLLESKADVEAKDRNGSTPLAWALETKFDPSIEMLLMERQDIDYEYEIDTPLLRSVEIGYEYAVRLLLEKGAMPTLKCRSGNSPLSLAKDLGSSEMIRLLESYCPVQTEEARATLGSI
ncbi:hypothetical protein B0T14DRAFT_501427 [Immersiella caudata]|uniref:NACHT domain-containing protein n=1 Tax=Immersiella caudata TaxID=314043 RepID=A0AA39XCR3_9PEZI|nr:hypothetical protein B0T14DRAFT_501427 [Immersiella caudata]